MLVEGQALGFGKAPRDFLAIFNLFFYITDKLYRRIKWK